MPFYEVVTPLRNGGKKPIAPGAIVEMEEDDARALVRVGALIFRNERPQVIFAEQPGQIAAVLGDGSDMSGVDGEPEPEPEMMPVEPEAAEPEPEPDAMSVEPEMAEPEPVEEVPTNRKARKARD